MMPLFARAASGAADSLFRHTAVLFIAMAFVHACNMGYQMVMGRLLSVEEFGLLSSFLSILGILSRPGSTLATAMNHFVGMLRLEGRNGDVKRLLRKWLLLVGAPSTLVAVFVVTSAPAIAAFFHLDRPAPVAVAGIAVPALLCVPVLSGAVQGLERFGLLAAGQITAAGVRLGAGAFFVTALYAASGWALLGHAAGFYTAFVLFLGGLQLTLWSQETGAQRLPSLRLYLAQSFVVQVSFGVLMMGDVVLVKRFLPAETGEFAYAATLARTVAFLPAAIAGAMAPKVVSVRWMSQGHRDVLLRSLAMTAICVAPAVLVCLLAPGLLLRILFGLAEPSADSVLLSRIMAGVMACSALFNILVQFMLAQRRFCQSLLVVGGAAGYLITAYFFHDAAWQIAVAAGAWNLAALLVGAYWLIAGSRK